MRGSQTQPRRRSDTTSSPPSPTTSRRGPAQAAFTTPELRELGELTRADVIVDPADLELDPYSEQWLREQGEPTNQRNVELLREYSCEGPPLSVIYPRATQHLAKVRVFAEFAADLMRNYEARARRKSERAAG